MKIQFPKYNNQRYWNIHYRFVLELFKGHEIEFIERPDDNNNLIRLVIGRKPCCINYSDFGDTNGYAESKDGTLFKMHCKEDDRAFAFSPISFPDWDRYMNVGINLHYQAEGFISARQRPYAGAKERREYVHKLLQNEDVRTAIIEQKEYWNEVEDVLVPVCVPGAHNNMLDRGQLQYMALGTCTISPLLPEILPFNKTLLPDVHYILCKDDYSDLIEKIHFCKVNKIVCLKIGGNAKQLFLETCTPPKILEWIERCLAI